MTLNQTSIFGPGDSGGSGGGSGDVVGPASSTNNALAVFNGTDGKLLKNSTLTNPSAGVLNIPSGGDLTFNATASTGTGGFVRATTPTLVTPVLGAATATSINFGETSLSSYVEGTYTPIVTLVGGTGNTTPVYTTNSGRYSRVGNIVTVDVLLTGDGGAEGAGTGQINISLPIAISASGLALYFPCGYAENGATRYMLYGFTTASSTTVALVYFSSVSATTDMTGAAQNNTSRNIRLKFTYLI